MHALFDWMEQKSGTLHTFSKSLFADFWKRKLKNTMMMMMMMLSLTSVSASEVVIGDVADEFKLPCQRVHAVTVTVGGRPDSNRRWLTPELKPTDLNHSATTPRQWWPNDHSSTYFFTIQHLYKPTTCNQNNSATQFLPNRLNKKNSYIKTRSTTWMPEIS